mgnify:FL=1
MVEIKCTIMKDNSGHLTAYENNPENTWNCVAIFTVDLLSAGIRICDEIS